jgi:hypothetical protein
MALSLPSDAPQFPAGPDLVKSSAAWLIEHAALKSLNRTWRSDVGSLPGNPLFSGTTPGILLGASQRATRTQT